MVVYISNSNTQKSKEDGSLRVLGQSWFTEKVRLYLSPWPFKVQVKPWSEITKSEILLNGHISKSLLLCLFIPPRYCDSQFSSAKFLYATDSNYCGNSQLI